jgi:hypothetical protein
MSCSKIGDAYIDVGWIRLISQLTAVICHRQIDRDSTTSANCSFATEAGINVTILFSLAFLSAI